MFLRAGKKTYSGFDAYRVLALALPPLWPLAPWLFFPGVSTLGKWVYGYVARNRLALIRCDPTCSTENTQSDNSMLSAKKHARRYVLGCRLAVAAWIAVVGAVWFNRIEYYPFTAVQMFTRPPGSVVSYYKTLGHWESGRVSRFYLEDTLGVMSINSRYEPLFDICFGNADQIAVCRKTLSILGAAYNGKARSGEKLTHLEIQRWKWDFGSNPRDPNHGGLEARFIGEVPADGRTQANVTPVAIEK
jgi:hypothetical protein